MGGRGSSAGVGKATSKPIGTVKQQRAVQNFLRNTTSGQVATNEFKAVGMSNAQAVKVLNSLGRGKYKLVKEQEKGTIWTNFAPVNKEYIRRI